MFICMNTVQLFRIGLLLSLTIAQKCDGIRQKSPPSLLEVSQVIVIKKDEGCYRLQCPTTSASSIGSAGVVGVINVIWILHRAHVVIGGGSKEISNLYKNYNHEKYEYIRGTGELQINNLSLSDAGVYRCIVELTVLWSNTSEAGPQYFYETAAVELVSGESPPQEFTGDITRAILAAVGTLLFLTITCLVYSYRWKESKPDKFDIEDRDQDPESGESCQTLDKALDRSTDCKSITDGDNIICNVSDSSDDTSKIFDAKDIQPSTISKGKNNKIFIISPPTELPANVQSSIIPLSPSGYRKVGTETMLIPPTETPPTLPSTMLLMRKKVEETQQDGISFFTSPHASTSTIGRPVPLFQFESTSCSTVTGRTDACQRKLTKQQWWWNWTDSNMSSETSITNKDSIAVETMQKLVAVPPITSPSPSEYSTVSTVSSSLAQKSSTTTLNVPLQMQTNL